jgi:(S)-ureidoglycine aminohydrolase
VESAKAGRSRAGGAARPTTSHAPDRQPSEGRMAQSGLVVSRAVVRRNYAILPPEGVAASVLPEWRETVARVLAAPAIGARFVEYLLDVSPGGGTNQSLREDVQMFLFVLAGQAELDLNGRSARLGPGAFAYGRPGTRFTLRATSELRLLWLKKVYVPISTMRPADLIGDETKVTGETYMGVEGLLLKSLLPAGVAYDMAMNVFTFPPGYSLPMIETHVMEHGLYFLQGQGLYYLGETWSEVKAGDFIWMGPYVPQSFYATSTTPSRYLYYKDVNRDVEL